MDDKRRFEVVQGRSANPSQDGSSSGPSTSNADIHAADRDKTPTDDAPGGPSVKDTPVRVQVENQADARTSSGVALLCIFAALPILYFGKTVFLTTLISVLLAFILEPLVRVFEKMRLPRPLASLASMLILTGALYGASYFSYLKAVDFAQQLPKYSQRIKQSVVKLRMKTQQITDSTKAILPDANKGAVKVQTVDTGWSSYFAAGSNVTEMVFSLSFIPFLAFFMSTWRDHLRRSAVLLFARGDRTNAYVAISNIAEMLRQFIVGNLLIGIIVGATSAAAFAMLHIPYFYFVGPISGFLSLVPYLGVLLAIVPPIAAGMGHLSGTGMLLVVGIVLGSHLIALNVLYPKILGSRLELNPLVVTFSLLFWGFMWGAMGLILAIPLTAAIKIIMEHIDGLGPLAFLLGEDKGPEPT